MRVTHYELQLRTSAEGSWNTALVFDPALYDRISRWLYDTYKDEHGWHIYCEITPEWLPFITDGKELNRIIRYEVSEHALAELRSMPYKDYLRTDHWFSRRDFAKRRAGYHCQVCNSDQEPLDVHHRTYERRGCESDTDLIVLCRKCHQLFHSAERLAVQA